MSQGPNIPVAEAPKVGDLNTAPTTTAAEDLTKAGQRHINLIWESTQAVIAVVVTIAVVVCAVAGKESAVLGNAFTLIVAIYFVRMNHTKTGGVGSGDYGR